MAFTNEQKAWQLYENGVDYAEVATEANQLDCTMNEAVESVWNKKFGGRND